MTGVELHPLGRDGAAAIRRLFDDCAEFFTSIHADHVGEAARIFDDVPPGTHAEQKLVLGAFARSEERRVGKECLE